MKPRLLDLFCGAGGAAMGYSRAGFEVVGVDIKPQPRYPFRFYQGDALEIIGLENGYIESWGIDAIHASPPCQAYSVANNIHGRTDHPELIAETRELLEATGLPYVIENVPGAPLRDAVTICGLSVGCNVRRHRLFECNFPVMVPPCGDHSGDWLLVFGHTVLERSKQIDRNTPSGGPRFRRKHVGTDRGREAMGIDWMNRDELSEAIPPNYTELIGTQLMAHLNATVAA
jgi:DNA (cytosine-5)-methyltransferase 1